MNRSWVLGGLVLCIGMRRVLVQRLRWTMLLGAGNRRGGKHREQQRRKQQLLHATNLARAAHQWSGPAQARTKSENCLRKNPTHLANPYQIRAFRSSPYGDGDERGGDGSERGARDGASRRRMPEQPTPSVTGKQQ